MKVTACVYDNGIGETAILGDDETDDVIPDDHSQFLSESSPREMAEVVGEVSGSEDSSVLSSAVVSIASTRSLALSSPLTSTVLPHPSLQFIPIAFMPNFLLFSDARQAYEA